MKPLTVITITLIILSSSIKAAADTPSMEKEIQDSYLYIYKYGSMNKIDSIINALKLQCTGKDNRYLTYWLAYAKYERAVASFDYYQYKPEEYASFKKTGISLIDEAVSDLEKGHSMTSEDYALVAMMKNVSIPFSNPLRIPFLSREIKKAAECSVKMDSMNLRGWLALAILDYYTPELYGGGKQFESLFQKVIDLDDRRSDFPYDPSWGKDEAYVYLIHYYRNTNPERAATLLKEAIALFPDNRRLKSLQNDH